MTEKKSTEFEELDLLEKELDEASLSFGEMEDLEKEIDEATVQLQKEMEMVQENEELELDINEPLGGASFEEENSIDTNESNNEEELTLEEDENNETKNIDEEVSNQKTDQNEKNPKQEENNELNLGQKNDEKQELSSFIKEKTEKKEKDGMEVGMELPEEPKELNKTGISTESKASIQENSQEKSEEEKNLDYFMSEDYKQEKITQILSIPLKDKEGKEILLGDIITEKEIWFTSDKGRPIVHDVGTDLIADKVGAEFEEIIVGEPTEPNHRGWYFKVICKLPNGDKGEEYGSGNDLNCESKISKSSKINMANKRGRQRALFSALKWHDFYSSSESDDFNRVEMIRKRMTELQQKHQVEKQELQRIIDLNRTDLANYKVGYAKQKKNNQNIIDYTKVLFGILEQHNLTDQLMNNENETIRQYTQSLLKNR